MQEFTATYSPEDNKLRLRAAARLPEELYKRVREAGFIWAPKQELFVAPMWTPARADLCLELAGEIGDEDTSLVERAEERAERFSDYQDKRADDAERARAAVSAIADNIPFGQPILVGHHSEKHARRDAEKIENGMRRAVKMWETSVYWERRAAGALRHAKYKELPTVRARRIKKIEADRRREQKIVDQAGKVLKAWTRDDIPLTPERALMLANTAFSGFDFSRCYTLEKYPRTHRTYEGPISLWSALGGGGEEPPIITPEQARETIKTGCERRIACGARWLEHYTNRLLYERAMLADQGAMDLLKKKPKSKAASLPLVNYRSPGGITTENKYRRGEMMHLPQVEMTQAQYAAIHSDYKGTRVVDNSHRVRCAMIRHELVFVFLTDSKVHDRPAPIENRSPELLAALEDERQERELDGIRERQAEQERKKAEAAPFVALREAIKTGVQVVAAPQLFPTPTDLAARMVRLAGIEPGQEVLEPSAGTGRLAVAIRDAGAVPKCCEINGRLADALAAQGFPTICGDFLERFSILDPVDDVGTVDAKMRKWDRVVMNPPFENGKDIKHIEHALKLLKPGGRLVALCANGPRQRAAFMDRAEHWEDLPAGTFAESGTQVNVALLVLVAENLAEAIPPMPSTTPAKGMLF